MNIVVFDEHQTALKLAVFAEVDDALDETFALVVARMSLAGKDELHGPATIVEQFDHVLELIEDQRGAFVSGKAPGKADGQGIRVQQLVVSNKVRLRLA